MVWESERINPHVSINSYYCVCVKYRDLVIIVPFVSFTQYVYYYAWSVSKTPYTIRLELYYYYILIIRAGLSVVCIQMTLNCTSGNQYYQSLYLHIHETNTRSGLTIYLYGQLDMQAEGQVVLSAG